MKDVVLSHRPVLSADKWMITSGHPQATQAGAHILENGGSAVDAAICANAVLSVVRPHMCGPGGDLFALVYSAEDGTVHALNASGKSPGNAGRDTYKKLGFQRFPEKGILSATVPGAVDGWAVLHERFGVLPFARLFEPAVDIADQGFCLYPELHRFINEESGYLLKSDAAKSVFFDHLNPKPLNSRLVMKDLARTFDMIAGKGRDVFYKGELADKFIAHSNRSGGFFSKQDLQTHASVWQEPIRTDYKGVQLLTQAPSSQGIAWLIMANILECADIPSLMDRPADLIHFMVQAKKLAFRDRDRYVGDPDFTSVPVQRLLDKSYARSLYDRIDLSRVDPDLSPPDFESSGDDTVYLAVVDEKGNAVSLIQSLYEAFGSCSMVEGTGMMLHNRARDFRLQSGHANSYEPGKRPYHTLTPAMIVKDEKPLYVLGSPGADGQTQTLIQMTVNLFERGLDPQEAVEFPRWRSNPDGTLLIENRFGQSVLDALAEKGHQVAAGGAYDSLCGSAQVIYNDPVSGFLFSGSDLRRQDYGIGK